MPRFSFLLRLVTLVVSAILLAMTAEATTAPAGRGSDVRATVEHFLLDQTTGLTGKVVIRIDTPHADALPQCDTLEPFLPDGARLWGRVSVGLRCTAGQPWTRYVPAYIAVVSAYYVAARQINFGQTLMPTDIAIREGDLTTLPAGVIVNAAELDGMTASNRIATGSPIRRELLRGAVLVQQGQNVKVVAKGAGFQVSTEGKAMTHAAAGAIIQVKLQGGQLISGKVGSNGIIERTD